MKCSHCTGDLELDIPVTEAAKEALASGVDFQKDGSLLCCGSCGSWMIVEAGACRALRADDLHGASMRDLQGMVQVWMAWVLGAAGYLPADAADPTPEEGGRIIIDP